MPDPTPDPTPGPPSDSASDASPDGYGTAGTPGRTRRSLAASRRQVVVAVLLAVLGFAFVVQVRDTKANDTYAGLREGELIEVLDGLTATAERARREVERLESRRDELRDENQARAAALDEAEQRVRTLNIIAGLVPVTGPGLRVTITETSGRVAVGSLLDTIQELRTAGAEAMEFNDTVRLGADSSFENAVGGIELDDQLLEPPYVLDVIGDPHILHTALTFSTGPIETLEGLDGATVSVEELESVEITSVRESVRPQYAELGNGQ
jgi:uncharacterized protein YlxW (UPF0749 family)